MVTAASLMWIAVMSILLYRTAALGSAAIKWYVDPKRPRAVKAIMLIAMILPIGMFGPLGLILSALVIMIPTKMRGPFVKFVIDLTLTFGMAIVLRLIIPGTSSAAVGAFVGIMLSIGLSLAGPYSEHVKQGYAT